jgi:hypothetical protein
VSHCGGEYQVAPAHPTGVEASPTSDAPFALGDVDEDGWRTSSRATTWNRTCSSIAATLQEGFAGAAPSRCPSRRAGVALGDVTGDGHLDLVFKWVGVSNVSLMTGDGSGAFTLHSTYATQIQDACARARGLERGRTYADLAIANSGAYSVSIRMSTGASGFGRRGVSARRTAARLSLAAGDVDGDGLRDLASATATTS